MKTRLLLDYKTILANQAQPVHFALIFQTDAIAAPRPKPAAFCIVLDRSGSMDGRPLETAKAATITAIRNLRSEDQFALVMFDDQAQVVLPLQPATSREVMMSLVQKLWSGGSTNLTAGWMLGRDELKKSPPAAGRRLLLLSDGHLNVGIVDRPQVRQIVADGLESGSIRTSCLGFGNSYDEKLMADLAEVTGGEFYDADSPEKFPHIFAKELEGLQKITIQNLRVRIKPRVFCESFAQLSTYPAIALPDGRQEFAVGDLISEEERALCFAVEVLPLPWVAGRPVASLEGEELLEVEILFDDIGPERITSRALSQVVRIQATQNPEEVRLDETVVPWVATQRAGQTFKQAYEQAEAGDQAKAIATLESAIRFLEKYGTREKVAEALRLLGELRARLQSGAYAERDHRWAHHHHHRMTKPSSRHNDENQPPPLPPVPPDHNNP